MRYAVLLAILFFIGCIGGPPARDAGANTFVLGEDLLDVDGDWQRPTMGQPPATQQEETRPEITSFSVSTDRASYHSRETISITVNYSVLGEIPGVRFSAVGIRNKWGNDLLRWDKLAYLREGDWSESFPFELPYCSSCSGLPPGTYHVYAEAFLDNETMARANCSFMFS
jgi:hypothetical protein